MDVDKDGIWKDAIVQCLPLIVKRMIPDLYNDVDFSQKTQLLDKELRDTIQAAFNGKHKSAKFVDTLAQLKLKTGEEQWVLLHIEVQGRGGGDISYRMFLYCCLLFAHYGRMPIALAILTDKRSAKETPGKFNLSEYGTELNYKYNLFEVYNQDDEQLLSSDNPFDAFIYAAKKYKDYMGDGKQEIKFKYLLKIARHLYARGLNKRDRANIILLVTRMVNLDDAALREEYLKEAAKLKGERKMRELNWLEEYFYDDIIADLRAKAMAEGEVRSRELAIDFMRSNGMTDAQIESFKKLFIQSDSVQAEA